MKHLGIYILMLFLSSSVVQGNPALLRLFAGIKALNYAMEEASKNPLDEPKRNQVRMAVRILPLLIVGLGDEFKNLKIPPSSFPAIQKALGSYIDVTAPDRYRKFMEKPDPSLIPKTGPGFPADITPLDLNSPEFAGQIKPASDTARGTSGSVALSPQTPTNGTFGGAASSRIVYARNARPQDFAKAQPKAQIDKQSAVARPQSDVSPFFREATDDLNRIERDRSGDKTQQTAIEKASVDTEKAPADLSMTSLRPALRRDSEKDENAIDEKFFDSKPKKAKAQTKKPTNLRTKRRELAPKDGSKAATKPNAGLWDTKFLMRIVVSTFGIPSAYGEEKEKGGQIAEILYGLAAIVQAIAPMVSEAIRSGADVDITRLNNNTQKALGTLASNTNLHQTKMSQETVLATTQIAKETAIQNQQFVTDRRQKEIDLIKETQDLNDVRDRERLAYEKYLADARINLANKQADEQVKLAREQLNASLTVQGFSSSGTSINSSGGLSSTRSGTSSTSQSQQTTETSKDQTTEKSLLEKSQSAQTVQSLGLVASRLPARDRLLEAVKSKELFDRMSFGDAGDDENLKRPKSYLLLKKFKKKSKKPLALANTRRIASHSARDLEVSLSAGSSRAFMQRTPVDKASEFNQFKKELARGNIESYWQGIRPSMHRTDSSSTSHNVPPPATGGHSAGFAAAGTEALSPFGTAYRPPKLPNSRNTTEGMWGK